MSLIDIQLVWSNVAFIEFSKANMLKNISAQQMVYLILHTVAEVNLPE